MELSPASQGRSGDQEQQGYDDMKRGALWRAFPDPTEFPTSGEGKTTDKLPYACPLGGLGAVFLNLHFNCVIQETLLPSLKRLETQYSHTAGHSLRQLRYPHSTTFLGNCESLATVASSRKPQ